ERIAWSPLRSSAMSSPAAVTIDPLAAFRLDGQVALVTGASSGLGERFSRVLHAAGATVVVAARRVDRLNASGETLPGSIAVVADVSLPADRERLVATALERCGSVHVLVNNAGIGATMPVEEETLADFRDVREVNVT